MPSVVAETSGFIAAITMTLDGMGATVLPRTLLDTLGQHQGVRLLTLTDPVVDKPVALVTPKRAKGIPAVEALRRTLTALR